MIRKRAFDNKVYPKQMWLLYLCIGNLLIKKAVLKFDMKEGMTQSIEDERKALNNSRYVTKGSFQCPMPWFSRCGEKEILTTSGGSFLFTTPTNVLFTSTDSIYCSYYPLR
jgi:hypothetical protein